MKRLILALVALTFFVPVSAQAHDAKAYQGKDWSEIYADHTYVAVHDKECDSHSVYVQWKEKGVVGSHAMTDLNGCKSGGSTQFVGHDHEVAYFRTCEYNDEKHETYCGKWAHKS